MTDPNELIQKAISETRLRREQKKKAEIEPRIIAASILKDRFEKVVLCSGGDPMEPSMQKWFDNFFNMYVLLAVPLDRFPDWRDDGVPHEAAGDFLPEWMDDAAKVLNEISPGLGK